MKDIKQKVVVDADVSGLKKVNSEMDAIKSGAIAAALTMAATGSKIAAAWAGVSSVIQDKLLGPLSGISGFALGWLRSLKSVTDEWGRLGAKAAGAFEMLNNQFRPLLGSLEAAKNRMGELRKFAQQTPFGMKDVAESNKILQNFTKGALATKQGMTLIGDAAAVAGSDLQSVSMWVGRLYDGLQSGRPVGEAAFRLQEMGIVTGQARNAIEKMQESGASFSQMWGVIEQELGRASGAMTYTSKTLQGLEQQLGDAQEAMSAGFGEGFLDGQKSSIEAQLKAVEMITPAMQEWGELSGSVSKAMGSIKLKVVETTAAIPGMSSAIAVAGNAWGAFNTILVGASAVVGGSKLIQWMRNGAQLSKSTADGVSLLGSAFKGLGSAADAFLSGDSSAAKGLAQTAVQAAKSGVAVGGLRGVLAGAAAGMRTVTTVALAMGRAMLLNPVTLMIAGLAALVGITAHVIVSHRTHAKAMRDYANETDNMVKSMDSVRNSMQTLQDLTTAHSSAVMSLADAYGALAEAQKSGDKKAGALAKERITHLGNRIDTLRSTNPNNLRMSDEEAARRQGNTASTFGLAEQRSLSAIGMLPGGEQNDTLTQFYERQIAESEKAEAALAELESIKKQASIRSMDDSTKERSMILGVAEAAQKSAVESARANAAMTPTDSTLQSLADAQAKLEDIRAEKEAITNLSFAGMDVARESGNETAILEAQIALYREYQAVAKAAEKDKSAGAAAKMKSMEGRVLSEFGKMPSPAELQAKEDLVKTVRGELNRKSDPARSSSAKTQLDQIAFEAAKESESVEMDKQSKLIAFMEDHANAMLRSIELERQRVEFAQKYNNLSLESAGAQMEALDAEESKLLKIIAEKKELLDIEMTRDSLNSEAEAQRFAGNNGAARDLEMQAAEKEAERIFNETRKSTLSETGDSSLAEEAATQASDNFMEAFKRKQSSETRGEGFAKSADAANAGGNRMETAAMQAERAGMMDRAAALRESAVRLREAASADERVLQKQTELGISKEEALKSVNAEIEEAKKQRAIDEQIRQQKEKLLKDGITTELDASHDENQGRGLMAGKKRRKQKSAEDKQSYMDQGFSESEAGDMAERTERQTRLADAEERNIEAANNLASAFESLYSWIGDMAELNKKRADYTNETKALQFEAGGQQGKADELRKSVQFENDVADVMGSLKMSKKDAEFTVRQRGAAEFEKDKAGRIEELNTKLAEARAGSGGLETQFNSTSFASSMSRIGGATALGGSESLKYSFQGMNDKLAQIRDLMAQMASVAGEQYYVHPTGQNYTPKVYIQGQNGTGGYIN